MYALHSEVFYMKPFLSYYLSYQCKIVSHKNIQYLPKLPPLVPLRLAIVLIRLDDPISFPSLLESRDFEPLLSKLRDLFVAYGYESGADPPDP